MSRKESFAEKTRTGLDPVYLNKYVFKLINRFMLDGKKAVAENIVYKAFEIVANDTKLEPLKIFLDIVENIRPTIEVRSRRVGGATYQIPTDVRSTRSYSLAIRWFVEESRKRKERTMIEKLAREIIDATNSTGNTFKRKENMMKTVEANRAFSHLSRH